MIIIFDGRTAFRIRPGFYEPAIPRSSDPGAKRGGREDEPYFHRQDIRQNGGAGRAGDSQAESGEGRHRSGDEARPARAGHGGHDRAHQGIRYDGRRRALPA